MPDYPSSFDHLLAAWNERDPGRIRGHLERAVSDDVLFADPNYLLQGTDAFEQMVREFRGQIPEARCSRASGIDSHHDRFRYEWLVANGDEPLVRGFDVATVGADGRIVRIDGFFGPFPPKDD